MREVSSKMKPFQRYVPFFEEQFLRNSVSVEVRGSFTFLRDSNQFSGV
jgi:hypothetical protein